ncbi:MAG: hypothetical protein MAG431_00543 [Chloroflexi bacterium]|nr:hypothetical protein [Chloroflexota bacterium]
MDQKLTGKRPSFRKEKDRINFSLILILLALIVGGTWFANEVYKTDGRFDPLFMPTPTATRTLNSHIQEAQAYFDAGKIYDPEDRDAIDAYQDALEMDPSDAETRAELARLLTYSSSLLSTHDERVERLSNARQEIERAAADAPDSSNVQAIRALVLDWSATAVAANQEERQEWLAEAEQAANLAITLDPDNALALAFYAEVLLDQNQLGQAREHAQLAVEQGPELMDTHRVYATVMETYGEYRYAIEEYKEAAEITPNLTFLYIRIGVVYRALKVYTSALEYFDKAITINNSNGVQDPLPYVGIAKTYVRMGEFFVAALNGKKAIEFDPYNANTYGQLGDIYVRSRNFEGALPVLKCAVEGCSAEENEVGGVDVEPLALTNFEIAYYYARYGSVLAALSRPNANYCPHALEVLDQLEDVYGDDPNLMNIVAENRAICNLLEGSSTP